MAKLVTPLQHCRALCLKLVGGRSHRVKVPLDLLNQVFPSTTIEDHNMNTGNVVLIDFAPVHEIH